jgi:hypothetical protein
MSLPLAMSSQPRIQNFAATLMRDARERSPWLWWGACAALAVSLPLLVLQAVDPRQLLGVSVWLKPWKFHVSITVHFATLAVAVALLPIDVATPRRVAWLSAVALASGVFELVYITGRSSLGLASHFAVSTTFGSVMYTLMGIGAVLLTTCAGVLGWWTLRTRAFAHGAVLQGGLAWGLLLGWLLGTASGAYLSGQGGHWVGGMPTDAGGLPMFQWSRTGGDLRVAHFFGLHAMQAVPLAAWALQRWAQARAAMPALLAFTGLWTGLTAFTFFQALSGRPFL